MFESDANQFTLLQLLLGAGCPLELLVHDEEGECPYGGKGVARLPMRFPLCPMSPAEYDARLEAGDRRQGLMFYSTRCPNCSDCVPIRLNVNDFRFSKTHRRVYRKCEETLRIELGPAICDEDRVKLCELHAHSRDLVRPSDPIMTLEHYSCYFLSGSVSCFEIRMYLENKLVGVAITDNGYKSMSAHYTYYDPAYSRLSLGTYAILKQVQIARRLEMQYLYLGLIVNHNKRLEYKARFFPHELSINGQWTRIDPGK